MSAVTTDVPVRLLAGIGCPDDVRRLPAAALPALAAEIRDELVSHVTATGGHLGPNLGVVELTIALHRVFASPRDVLVWDTGHQAYVHKMLTGRLPAFDTLRQAGGLSGYPCRAESDHDVVENSHASTSLAYADGLAKAFALQGRADRRVVAVVGDGALTGGMCWEALNNIGSAPQRPVVVVLNDNGRSYGPTAGHLPQHLRALREGSAAGNLFEDLGLGYVGAVDGHDVAAVEAALRAARALRHPVVVHVVTRKGAGHPPAEHDEVDRMHTVSPAPTLPATRASDPVVDARGSDPVVEVRASDPVVEVRASDPVVEARAFDPVVEARGSDPVVEVRAKRASKPPAAPGLAWTDAFGDALVEVGSERDDVVAITAAMLRPTGLLAFSRRFPERVFDVGIAEQHAVASAAGLAAAGLHPVVAIYSTFLNRAFDQVLMDTALHRASVTFVLDRAGITGPDGPSHHGMWDLSLLGLVPGARVAAPRDAEELRSQLRACVAYDGPSVLRFPRGRSAGRLPARGTVGTADVLAGDPATCRALLLPLGPLAVPALEAAGRLEGAGVPTAVVDPRWVHPLDPELVAAATRAEVVVTVEDNAPSGGFGDTLARALRELDASRVGTGPVLRTLALPDRSFVPAGPRPDLLARHSLDAEGITAAVLQAC